MSEGPRWTNDDLFSIRLRPCTAGILRHLLDPMIPFVWIVGYQPNPRSEWWHCRLPMSRSGRPAPVEVRGLRCDLLMPTSRFFERLDDFDGLDLFQMRRSVPDTLVLEALEDHDRVRILVQNGLYASFSLPRPMECATFATVERSAMERALANETVRSLAY